MSEPTGHRGDSTGDVIPNDHCSSDWIRTVLTSFGRHGEHRTLNMSQTETAWTADVQYASVRRGLARVFPCY